MALTQKQKKEYADTVGKLVTKWVDILGLAHWQIGIYAEDCGDDDVRAFSVGWMPGYRQVVFTVNTSVDFVEFNLRPEIVEHRVVHELVHLLMAPVRDLFHTELEAGGSLWPRFTQANEESTEAITAAILLAYRAKDKKEEPHARRTRKPTGAGSRPRKVEAIPAASDSAGS